MLRAAHNQRHAQSKLASALFAMALHDHLAKHATEKKEEKWHNIKAVCADPGFVKQAPKPVLLQTAADGAIPLLAAAFTTYVNSGDMYAPEGGTKGLPKKVIARGVPSNKKEQRACDADAKAAVWDESEATTGVHFHWDTYEVTTVASTGRLLTDYDAK